MKRTVITTIAALSLGAFALVSIADEPSLDDLLKIPTPHAPEAPDQAKPADDAAKPDLQIDPALLEPELSAAEASDAFKAAVADMNKVAGRLADAHDPTLPTQRMQESILARLDKVIDAAQKQCKQCQGGGQGSGQPKPQQQDQGSQKNAKKPGSQQGQQQQPGASASRDQGSKGAVAPHQKGGNIEELRAEWGHLPPRLRNELIQGRDDAFSATYKSLTAEYYKRLAEEGK
jgi:hypothetical protein